MMKFVLLAVVVGACALGDDDGPASDPGDARAGAGVPDSRTGPIVDAGSGLPDSRPYPDAPPPPDAAPVYDAAPCGTAGPDTCEAATDLTAMAATASGATVNEDTTLLLDTLAPSSECTGYSNPGHDAIYKVTANAGQTIRVTLTPTGTWDPSVYITNSCASTACVAGADTGFGGGAETTMYAVTMAGTYYVVVDGYASYAFGCYGLNVKLE